MICIYKIRNVENGKVYVGSTEDYERRLKEHMYELQKGTHVNTYLQNAFNKHGQEIFSIEVIEELDSIDNLLEREQYWIDTLNAHWEKGGYNLSPTAGRTTGYKYTPEQSARLSAIIRKRYENMTDEQRAFISSQMSKALKGKKKPEGYGDMVRARQINTALPETVRKNMSKAHSGENNSRATINETIAAEIKVALMAGIKKKDIMEKYSCSKYVVDGIFRNESWKNVYVEGYDEWVAERLSRTTKNRTRRVTNSKLNEDIVREIKKTLLVEKSRAKVARMFNVSFDTVHYIAKGVTWKHVTIEEEPV